MYDAILLLRVLIYTFVFFALYSLRDVSETKLIYFIHLVYGIRPSEAKNGHRPLSEAIWL